MPDREKYIEILSKTVKRVKEYNEDTPIKISLECVEDILELLKEHEAIKPKRKVRHGANAQIQHFCGNCNSMLHGKPKFCSECGKGVLW